MAARISTRLIFFVVLAAAVGTAGWGGWYLGSAPDRWYTANSWVPGRFEPFGQVQSCLERQEEQLQARGFVIRARTSTGRSGERTITLFGHAPSASGDFVLYLVYEPSIARAQRETISFVSFTQPRMASGIIGNWFFAATHAPPVLLDVHGHGCVHW